MFFALQAAARLGFAKESRDLWKSLDKDDSGSASIDELDPRSAEGLAHFKAPLHCFFCSTRRPAKLISLLPTFALLAPPTQEGARAWSGAGVLENTGGWASGEKSEAKWGQAESSGAKRGKRNKGQKGQKGNEGSKQNKGNKGSKGGKSETSETSGTRHSGVSGAGISGSRCSDVSCRDCAGVGQLSVWGRARSLQCHGLGSHPLHHPCRVHSGSSTIRVSASDEAAV